MTNFSAKLWERYTFEKHIERDDAVIAFDKISRKQVLIRKGESASSEINIQSKRQSLMHPNILKIHEIFDIDDASYWVTEYCGGETLASFLARADNQKGLPVQEIIDIGISLCQALQVTHDGGLVHQHLSAENIWLCQSSAGLVPKLANFGGEPVSVNVDTHFVNSSPEQLQALPAQVATDVYAFGVLLYRLFTHTPYLPGTNDDLANYWQVLQDSPRPPAELRSDIPEALNQLIMQMLAKEPQSRPSIAQVYHQLLHPKTAPSTPVPASRQANSPLLWFGIGVTGVIVPALMSMLLLWGYIQWQSDTIVNLPSDTSYQVMATITPTPNIATPTLPQAVVQNSTGYGGLKLRAEASRDAQILHIFADGDTLGIIKFNDDQSWAQVQSEDNKIGWVFVDRYLRIDEN